MSSSHVQEHMGIGLETSVRSRACYTAKIKLVVALINQILYYYWPSKLKPRSLCINKSAIVSILLTIELVVYEI